MQTRDSVFERVAILLQLSDENGASTLLRSFGQEAARPAQDCPEFLTKRAKRLYMSSVRYRLEQPRNGDRAAYPSPQRASENVIVDGDVLAKCTIGGLREGCGIVHGSRIRYVRRDLTRIALSSGALRRPLERAVIIAGHPVPMSPVAHPCPRLLTHVPSCSLRP